MSTNAAAGWLVAGMLSAAVVGCGGEPKTYPVQGKVVFRDGTPVRFGQIETLSAEQRVNARGSINPDGTFSLTTYEKDDGAVPGKHSVVILQTTAVPLAIAAHATASHSHGNVLSPLPRYRDYTTSGLTLTVVPDSDNTVTLTVDAAAQQE